MNYFVFKPKLKIFFGILILVGVLGSVSGLLDEATHGQRFWSNLLINSFFFFGLGLGALFFLALQKVAQAGWSVLLKRIFEATSLFLPVAAIFIILSIAASSLHIAHTYHWMVEGIMDETHANFDPIIAGKSGFLNLPFFWIRTLIYLAVFIGFALLFRKRSLQEDQVGGLEFHKGNINLAAGFMVLFAIFSSVLSWDWIMSIDTHWFSTLFGWYSFAGVWCSSMVFMTILVLWLKTLGYLPQVNENHIHDMGKWVFALSFLWAYTWFSQFMLIWYADIPEEVTYYQERFDTFNTLTWVTFAVNFVLPMVFLMSRNAKRNPFWLTSIGIIIFIGHWLDVYLMVMPGTLHDLSQLGFTEIGMFLGFLGLFLWVVLKQLSNVPLVVEKNVFLEESIHHHF